VRACVRVCACSVVCVCACRWAAKIFIIFHMLPPTISARVAAIHCHSSRLPMPTYALLSISSCPPCLFTPRLTPRRHAAATPASCASRLAVDITVCLLISLTCHYFLMPLMFADTTLLTIISPLSPRLKMMMLLIYAMRLR